MSDTAGQPDKGSVFVQWKGTDACLDLHCVCGHHGHLDDMFAYGVQCPICDRVYEMPHTFDIAPSDFDHCVRIAFGGRLHQPSGEGVPLIGLPCDEIAHQELRERIAELTAELDRLRADTGGER